MTPSAALSNRQVIRAALVVLLGFVASGILGVIRTAVFSSTFGTSSQLDAFYAAQRIPEMLFTLVAGGALGSSFLPVFTRHLSTEDRTSAWRLASAVMTLSALAATLLAILLYLFAPVLVPSLLVPRATPDEQALTIMLTRMMLSTTVIFSISGLLMGILNAHQLFLLPSLAISMNNVGLIIGALVIAPALPHTSGLAQMGEANITGLAWGALLGALLHLAIQIPGLFKVKARLRPLFAPRLPGVREVMMMMGPRVLGLAVVQINFAVNVAFASGMAAGSQVALNTAWFLMFFALGILAQSAGTAIFPSLAALAAKDDMEGFRQRLSSTLRSVLFLVFPASVGLIVLGRPIVALLFQRGEFTTESTAATAWALSFFAFGMAGHALLEVLSRAFYALSDTWTPVRVGLISMISNIVLSIIFIQFIGEPGSLARGPFAGLALSNSLTTLLEGAALWWLMSRRLGGAHDSYLVNGAMRALAAALGMGIGVWFVTERLIDTGDVPTALIGMGVGCVLFFGLALALGIEEARTVPRMIFRRR